MRRPQINQERVKWENDKKQKKLTKRHLQQQIDSEKRSLDRWIAWLARDEQYILRARQKIHEMELQLKAMEKDEV